MEKILENTYRNINIGLVNELTMLCNEMGISMWEVVDAAKTKPYGFQPFYPGPGLGGHCIPLDPYYLSWKAREYGFHTSMIESSMMINDKMPEYCVDRAAKMLNRRAKKAMNGSKVLVLGVPTNRTSTTTVKAGAAGHRGAGARGRTVTFFDHGSRSTNTKVRSARASHS